MILEIRDSEIAGMFVGFIFGLCGSEAWFCIVNWFLV